MNAFVNIPLWKVFSPLKVGESNEAFEGIIRP